ncbi:hypothetical protein BDN72DRAFT_879784 [Pluteus cervinus]|uniref:Uncharacterized protein n=1 Tax=Pluteus cervinus TaxID=181527 RepID=A0ACD3ANX2_9AGAR|nr:hypothetical protein BDN72DRAFT_879784 [Pluteus cervinus]
MNTSAPADDPRARIPYGRFRYPTITLTLSSRVVLQHNTINTRCKACGGSPDLEITRGVSTGTMCIRPHDYRNTRTHNSHGRIVFYLVLPNSLLAGPLRTSSMSALAFVRSICGSETICGTLQLHHTFTKTTPNPTVSSLDLPPELLHIILQIPFQPTYNVQVIDAKPNRLDRSPKTLNYCRHEVAFHASLRLVSSLYSTLVITIYLEELLKQDCQAFIYVPSWAGKTPRSPRTPTRTAGPA